MTPEQLEDQAGAFLDFHRRRGGCWEDAWAIWAASKDLHPADAAAIRSLVLAELVASGASTFTDPMAWVA